MSNDTDSPSTSAGTRLVRFEAPEKPHHRPALSTQSSFLSNLMYEHHKDRDPLFYYEVLNVVGVGSMGSVAIVRKRHEVMGGSARKDVVDSLRRQEWEKECFSIPFFGSLVRFCMEDMGIGKSSRKSSGKSSGSVHGSDHSPTSATGDSTSTSSFRSSKRNIFTSSERSVTSDGTYQEMYAMKSIHLSRIADETFVEELKNEIAILKRLDHPHIVRPIETFNHRNQLFIVMELCSGGDLYSRDPYTEEEAARIVDGILSAVSYMHNKGIVHRDLKYENILFVNESPKAVVKLIDFGLSKTYGEGQEMHDGVGTIYTMAPEVLKGNYTAQADLWSVGVIAYMLLSSQMPFYGKKRRHIVEQILQCKYDFKGRRWQRISPQAKAFVESLLVDNPDERATAEEALVSTWLNKRYGATVRGPTEKELETTISSLSTYSHYYKLKKLALLIIANKSTSDEIGILRKVFEEYDTDNSGVISPDEFKAALQIYGYSDDELESMFNGMDVDQTGEVKYVEFLAATIEATGAISEERLAEAFDRLDSDDSGYITTENLRELLGNEVPEEEINAIIQEADITHDNQISYSEFLALWENKNEKKRESLVEEWRRHRASISDESDHWTNSRRQELIDDSSSENHTLARANYIQGKQLSERRMSKNLTNISQLSSDDMAKLLYGEDVAVELHEPDKDIEPVGNENLIPAMKTSAVV